MNHRITTNGFGVFRVQTKKAKESWENEGFECNKITIPYKFKSVKKAFKYIRKTYGTSAKIESAFKPI